MLKSYSTHLHKRRQEGGTRRCKVVFLPSLAIAAIRRRFMVAMIAGNVVPFDRNEVMIVRCDLLGVGRTRPLATTTEPLTFLWLLFLLFTHESPLLAFLKQLKSTPLATIMSPVPCNQIKLSFLYCLPSSGESRTKPGEDDISELSQFTVTPRRVLWCIDLLEMYSCSPCCLNPFWFTKFHPFVTKARQDSAKDTLEVIL